MRIALAEQVWIDLEPASFGSRSLAYILDFIIRWGAFAFLLIAFLFTAGKFFDVVEAFTQGFEFLHAYLGKYVWAVIVFLFFFVEWSYPIFFEVFRDGVTPGKKAFGLRVINENGLPPTFKASFLRTLLLTLDLQGLASVGLLSMFFSKKSQRLGDLVAKTMVVYEDKQYEKIKSDESSLYSLKLEVYNVIEEYIRRNKDLTVQARDKALSSIFKALLKDYPELEIPKEKSQEERQAWLKDFFKTAQPQKSSEARSKRDVLINWQMVDRELDDLEKELGLFDRKNKKKKDRQALLSFAESYQRLCQHFSYLATFYPNTYEAKKASNLVRKGRRLIYGKRLSALQADNTSYWVRVPESFHVIRNYAFLSLTVGVVGAFVAAVLVQLNPNISWYFLSEETVAALKMGRLWTEEIQGVSAVASSRIMTNNIAVTFTAFAFGITAGIGTVLVLLFNGALLGGMFSALTFYDMAYRLFDFVVAHGFLELSVIFVAGGCGLYLGDALIHPGTLSRKRALQKHAAVVVDLILFNALCLILAGVVEGYISPYPFIPFWFKLGVGLVLGYAYWAYLFWAGLLPRKLLDL